MPIDELRSYPKDSKERSEICIIAVFRGQAAWPEKHWWRRRRRWRQRRIAWIHTFIIPRGLRKRTIQKPRRTAKCCCETDCSWRKSSVHLRLHSAKRTLVLLHQPTAYVILYNRHQTMLSPRSTFYKSLTTNISNVNITLSISARLNTSPGNITEEQKVTGNSSLVYGLRILQYRRHLRMRYYFKVTWSKVKVTRFNKA